MKAKEIKVGETYLFVATDDPKREHLAGKPFSVSLPIYSHSYGGIKSGFGRKIKGFKNADGEFALAEELQELPAEDVRCQECGIGKIITEGIHSIGSSVICRCSHCGHTQTFP